MLTRWVFLVGGPMLLLYSSSSLIPGILLGNHDKSTAVSPRYHDTAVAVSTYYKIRTVVHRRSDVSILSLLRIAPSTRHHLPPIHYVPGIQCHLYTSFFGCGHVNPSGLSCGRGPGEPSREKKGWRKLWEDVHGGMDRV